PKLMRGQYKVKNGDESASYRANRPGPIGGTPPPSRSRKTSIFDGSNYRRSVIFANAPPLVSHFSCLFQGIWDSGFASGSLTRPTCSFWEAQETNTVVAASKRAAAI